MENQQEKNQTDYNCPDIGTVIEKMPWKANPERDKVLSGFCNLDRLIGGFESGNLIIVGARPGMGKTAFALSMARNIAIQQNKPIAFFSMEMSDIDLVARFISSETGLNVQRLKAGELNESERSLLATKIDALAKAPIFIDDPVILDTFELRERCHQLKQKHDIQMVFVDYLQLMQGKGTGTCANRKYDFTKTTLQLKALAKELKLPVLVTSQLSRVARTCECTKQPQLSQLRKFGDVEQNADVVMLIHRPDYYGESEDENGNSILGMADILLEKHRNGPTGVARLKFVREFVRFEDPNYKT
jgi:replicative DNA helicase